MAFLYTEEDNGIITLTIKREDKLNALSSDVFYEFHDAVSSINRSQNIKVCIIKGAGRAFCAGVDINEFNDDFQSNDISMLNEKWGAVADIKIPTIACVHGYVLGGGFEIALMCDMIVAAESTKFGFPEINIGLIPGNGGTQRMPRKVGRNKAFEMMATGEYIDTSTAYSFGFINKIAKDGCEYEEAKKLAATIANKLRHSLIGLKLAINMSQNSTLQSGLTHESEIFKRLLMTNESRQLVQKFCDKKQQ